MFLKGSHFFWCRVKTTKVDEYKCTRLVYWPSSPNMTVKNRSLCPWFHLKHLTAQVCSQVYKFRLCGQKDCAHLPTVLIICEHLIGTLGCKLIPKVFIQDSWVFLLQTWPTIRLLAVHRDPVMLSCLGPLVPKKEVCDSTAAITNPVPGIKDWWSLGMTRVITILHLERHPKEWCAFKLAGNSLRKNHN